MLERTLPSRRKIPQGTSGRTNNPRTGLPSNRPRPDSTSPESRGKGVESYRSGKGPRLRSRQDSRNLQHQATKNVYDSLTLKTIVRGPVIFTSRPINCAAQ